MTGYITAALDFVCGKHKAQEASITSCDFTAFSPFSLKQTFVCLDVLDINKYDWF